MKKTILILLILLPLTVFASDLKGNITVEIDGIRNDKGDMLITLFTSEDGFPENPEKAYIKTKGKIKAGKSEFIFTGIPYGKYAIATHHDENANEKMDKNILGIPREGIGVSNNPKSFLGPPKFEDAKFLLNSESLNINITIEY